MTSNRENFTMDELEEIVLMGGSNDSPANNSEPSIANLSKAGTKYQLKIQMKLIMRIMRMNLQLKILKKFISYRG